MKQKQVKTNTKNAKQAKTTKKQSPAKKVEELEQENEEEEDAPMEEITPVKKAVNKKKSVVLVQQPEEEEEEEDESENDEEEQAEDDEEEEEQDGDEEEQDDDDGPTEMSIDEEPTIPSKVKGGPIPDSIPITQVVHVNKLPKKCKKVDIVEIFAKFGPIEQIHIVTSPSSTVANVAFKTDKAATAALAANKTVVKDSTIEVSMKKGKFDVKESRDRSVYVKYLKRGTTEEQIKEHFGGCGEIDRIKLVAKNSVTFAFVTFVDKAAVLSAKKLHNSVLNDTTIWVYENSSDSMVGQRDDKLTIILKNKQSFEKLEGSILETIFSKCGEIESMDVLCKKNTLAFITFKTEEGVKKAFKLSGKTIQDVELEIEQYNPDKKKTSIYISNIHKDATEEDLQVLFSKAGEIAKIVLKKGYAIIHFTDSDGYCKSFLLNEAFIKNQIIFVEPHSMRKQFIMKNRHPKPFNKSNKRAAGTQNGNSVFTPKKAKIN